MSLLREGRTPMKVLWFANTPCGAAPRLGKDIQVGGWLVALEKGLKNTPDLRLHVAFYHDGPQESFLEDGVTYHPIQRRHGLYAKLRKRVGDFARADHEDVLRMRAVLQAVDPDLVHVHGTEENFGLLQEHSDIPLVISMQGILGPYLNQFHSGIPQAFLRRKFPVENLRTKGFGHHYMAIAAHREARIMKRARWVFGRTEWDRRVASVLAPEATYLHGGEILRGAFYGSSPASGRPAPEVFELVSVISGGLYKGLETILRAASLLRGAGLAFRWSIVGLAQDDLFVTVCERFTGLDAAGSGIRFLGRKSGEQLADLLAGADGFVHASHIENSPNSVCEAMLLGLPVVATASGGTDSLLRTGHDGILVQPGEPYAMAGAILDMARSPDLRKEMGRSARAAALARHDPATVCQGILEGYRRVLQGPKGVDGPGTERKAR